MDKYVKYGVRVQECVWNDDKGTWKVKLTNLKDKTDFEDEAEVLIHGA